MATKSEGKAIFKGTMSLGGLLNVGIKIIKATDDSGGYSFHEYHVCSPANLSRVGRKQYCKGCGKDLVGGDIIKGIEVSKDNVVLFTPTEIESLPLNTTRVIEIDRFSEPSEIRPILVEANYYMLPEKTSMKAFQLFRSGLMASSRVAVGKVALRNRENICAVSPVPGGALQMSLLRYDNEVREVPTVEVPEGTIVGGDELTLITKVIEKYAKPFSNLDYKDDYAEALEKLVVMKDSGQVIIPLENLSSRNMPSLEDALKNLLEV